MKIFISSDDKKNIKKNYKTYLDKNLAIIDVPVMAKLIKYSEYDGDICVDYVLSQEIEIKIRNIYESKRFDTILYIIDSISIGFVSNFKKYVESKGILFTEYILIDYSQTVDNKIYKYFDNVI